MQGQVLTPSEFTAILNQTLEYAYPSIAIEGELSSFKISKNRWIYFDLKDEIASIKFFGTVYMLPGPIKDGMKVRVAGMPRLHPRFGFSVNVVSITPAGEGSIKKAAELLAAKLEAEGLFDPARKRLLPKQPELIGLITASTSAAFNDFIKILNERWGGAEVQLADVYVQGAQAPPQIIAAIEYFNARPVLPDVLVITRGGGSAEDLVSFNDERVVRAVAASRIPTLVAVGHETDTALAELAADMRASTPTNAAQLAVPNRDELLNGLSISRNKLSGFINQRVNEYSRTIKDTKKLLANEIRRLIHRQKNVHQSQSKLIEVFDPRAALKRGYAMVSRAGEHISSVKVLAINDSLDIQLADGKIGAKVEDL